MIEWLKLLFTGRNNLIDTIREQQALLNELKDKKDIFTVITPIKESNAEEYYAVLSQLYDSQAFKWILFDMERATMNVIKESTDIETLSFCRGELAIIDIIHEIGK